MKMIIDSDTSEEKNLESAIKHHELNPVTEKIDKIIRKSKLIIEAQKQETEIEDSFSMIQLNYTWNFIVITVVQIAVVLIIGIYHLYSFKKFLYSNDFI